MPVLRLVCSEGQPCDGAVRVRQLQALPETYLPFLESYMRELQTGTDRDNRQAPGVGETVVVISIKHGKPLPANIRYKLEAAIYDACAVRGDQPTVSAQLLEVREQ